MLGNKQIRETLNAKGMIHNVINLMNQVISNNNTNRTIGDLM